MRFVRFVRFVRFGEGGGTAWTARMDAVHYLNEPERAARLIAPSSAPCPKPTRHAPPSMFFRRRRAASRAVIRDKRADRSRKLAVGDRMTLDHARRAGATPYQRLDEGVFKARFARMDVDGIAMEPLRGSFSCFGAGTRAG